MKITFGEFGCHHVCIEVLSYAAPAHGDSLEDNFLHVEVSVSAGEFRGRAGAAICTFEFTDFADQLRRFYEVLNGSVEFEPMEGQLSLKLTGDGRGHIELEGELLENYSSGCRLSFRCAFDQTELHRTLHELDSVIRAFPVRGAAT